MASKISRRLAPPDETRRIGLDSGSEILCQVTANALGLMSLLEVRHWTPQSDLACLPAQFCVCILDRFDYYCASIDGLMFAECCLQECASVVVVIVACIRSPLCLPWPTYALPSCGYIYVDWHVLLCMIFRICLNICASVCFLRKRNNNFDTFAC